MKNVISKMLKRSVLSLLSFQNNFSVMIHSQFNSKCDLYKLRFSWRQSNLNLHHGQRQLHTEITNITGRFVIKSKCRPKLSDFYQLLLTFRLLVRTQILKNTVLVQKKRKERSELTWAQVHKNLNPLRFTRWSNREDSKV